MDGKAKHVWYAEDSAAGRNVQNLKEWPVGSSGGIGSSIWVAPEQFKNTLLPVKQDFAESAKSVFKDTGVQISTEGNCYLGSSIGSTSFLKRFTMAKDSYTAFYCQSG